MAVLDLTDAGETFSIADVLEAQRACPGITDIALSIESQRHLYSQLEGEYNYDLAGPLPKKVVWNPVNLVVVPC